MHHAIFTVLWEKLHSLHISHKTCKCFLCQVGQRNTFPLKLCALLLVKLTKMGVTGKPDKTSPTYKTRALLFTLVPWRHTLEILRVPFRGKSELRAVLRSVTLFDESTRGWNNEAFTPKGIHQESTRYTRTRTPYSSSTKNSASNRLLTI